MCIVIHQPITREKEWAYDDRSQAFRGQFFQFQRFMRCNEDVLF